MSQQPCDILHVIATSPWPATTDRLLGRLGDGEALCVIDTGCDAPAADVLRRRADRLVNARGLRKRFALLDLRRALAELRPTRLHAWGADVLTLAVAAAGRRAVQATIVDLPPPRHASPPMRAKALARCERIEAGDDTIAEALGELGADPQRLEVLPPLQVDPPELPAKAEARRRLGLPGDEPVVLTAGPWPRRALIEPTVWAIGFVARIRPAMRLLMVHDGHLGHYLSASAAANDLGGIPMPAAAEGTRLPADALAAADCFVAAPWRRGPSLALAEAAAAGLPLIVADTASNRYQLTGAGQVSFCGRPLPIRLAMALQRQLSGRKGAGLR